MKKKYILSAALACLLAGTIAISACKGTGDGGSEVIFPWPPSDNQTDEEEETINITDGGGRATALGLSAEARPLGYSDRDNANFKAVASGAESFAQKFTASTCTSTDSNVTVSPVSVYMALSLAAECASGQTRSQLLSVLGVEYTQLTKGFPYFYRSLENERRDTHGKIISRLELANSIWLDGRVAAKDACIGSLSQSYFCDSYHIDFLKYNAESNKAVSNYIKKQTHGLIDVDLKMTQDTVMALINTLYLRDVWNDRGDDLGYTSDKYDFIQGDGTVKNLKLLSGYYQMGRAVEREAFRSFFAQTESGYKLNFIVPKDGHTLSEVFTGENIADVNSVTDYGAFDKQYPNRRYHTRCLFPEYEADFSCDVAELLKGYGVSDLFSKTDCNFTNVCDFSRMPAIENVYCSEVRHVAKLKVDKKGVEGAAVTAVIMNGVTSAPPQYEDIYEDFLVDRAFGFVITDGYGTTLFSGVVNKV